jgi:hypothetical protein
MPYTLVYPFIHCMAHIATTGSYHPLHFPLTGGFFLQYVFNGGFRCSLSIDGQVRLVCLLLYAVRQFVGKRIIVNLTFARAKNGERSK